MCHKYTYFILQKFWYACVLSMAAVSSPSHTCLLVCRSLVMQAKIEWIHKIGIIKYLRCSVNSVGKYSDLSSLITSFLSYYIPNNIQCTKDNIPNNFNKTNKAARIFMLWDFITKRIFRDNFMEKILIWCAFALWKCACVCWEISS